MNNDELKKKIWKTILDTIYNYPDDAQLYNHWLFHVADALIAAGIGDVKEAELERKAYEVASNQYRIWLEEQQDRAKVAERALVMACANMVKDEKSNVNIEYVIHVLYYKYLKQAEKELAEGRK